MLFIRASSLLLVVGGTLAATLILGSKRERLFWR